MAFRRTILAAAIALAGTIAVASPAVAASDGTSNTVLFAEAAVRLDAPHHRLIVSAPSTGVLAPGKHFDALKVTTPRSTFVMSDILVSSLAGRDSLSLNFTKVEFMDYTDDSCMGTCLIEEEGLFYRARAVAGGQEGEE